MQKRLAPGWIAVIVLLVVLVADVLRFAWGHGDSGLLLQQTINALTLGGIYALIAVGYTLIYGIVKLINFAHGEIYMLGAFFGILLIQEGWPFFPALLIGMVGCAIVSMSMDQIAYRPLRQQFRSAVLVPLILALAVASLFVAVLYKGGKLGFGSALAIQLGSCTAFIVLAERFAFMATSKASPRLAALITAIGMSLFLQNYAMLVFGAEMRRFPDLAQERVITVAAEPLGSSAGTGDAGVPLPEDVAKLLSQKLTDVLSAARAGNLAEVPFAYGYVASWEAMGRAEYPDAASRTAAEVELQNRANEVAQVDEFKVWLDEGRVKVSLAFRTGTPSPADQAFRRDLKAWMRNPTKAQDPAIAKPGLGLPMGDALRFSDEQAEHIFQKDTALMVVGPPEDGVRRAYRLPVKTLFVWFSALAILVGMHMLVHHTSFGAAMRACALDREAASLMGVNVNRIILVTFMLSGAMAAVAGMLYGLDKGANIGYRMGYYAGVMAFFAAVLGGIGNLKGAVIGGLILGFVQAISEAYVTDWVTARLHTVAGWLHDAGLGGAADSNYVFNTSYAYAIACIILITVILLRPTGILGSAEADRA